MKYLKRNNLFLSLYHYVYLIVCLFMVTGVFGQNNTKAIHKLATQQDSLRLDKISTLPADSSTRKWQKKLDNLKLITRQTTQRFDNAAHSADSLSNKQIAVIMALKYQSDSIYKQLKVKQNAVSDKITSIEKKISTKQDSLYQGIEAKLKSITARSFKPNIKNPVDSQWQKINKYLPQQQEQLREQQQKVEKIYGKTNEMDKILDELKQYQPDAKFSKELNAKLKELQGLQHEKQQLGNLNEQLARLKGNYGDELDKLKALGDLSKYKQKLKAVAGNLSDYQQQVNNVDVLAENKLGSMEQVQAFEKQKEAFEPSLSATNQLKDPDYAKKQMVNKGKAVLKDHFAEHQDKLSQARDKLTRLKQKMAKLGQTGKVNSDGKTLKKQNEMNNKTLGERLVLEGNFQLHRGDRVSLDISPTLAYRWTKKLKLGLGGTFRTTFDEREKFLLSNENQVFGYRGYAEHDVYKGFFAHAEYERVKGGNTLPKNSSVGDENTDAWQNGALAGLGKSYKIKNKIMGKVMVLYNFLYDEQSPYNNPWNLRFGFELPGSGSGKQKNKKTEKQ